MEDLDAKDRWFDTPEDDVLCRGGGNGPITVTQIMPLVKFTHDGESFLDVGCGSGTTIDALQAIKRQVQYKGLDIISHRVKWLQEHYPDRKFEIQHATELYEADKSWDTVWSRHVIDHVDSFEKGMDEHCRVAKKRVICVLWYALTDALEHRITHVTYDGIVYKDEYLNQYSKTKIKEYLDNKCKNGWKLSEYLTEVSWQGDRLGKGEDSIIVLERI
jgi:ubiquinone/menaquinone biosynthesis C-methylase UbiE